MTYCCYVVATPIGNLADISQRALEVLSQVGLILAEDTRHSKKLLNHYGIKTRMRALHDHNETGSLEAVLAQLATQDVALISDAGTPLISDPGYKLVRFLRSKGIAVVPVPGASAMTAALSVAGLPTDRFSFEGFLASSKSARETALNALTAEPRTMVFYESPKRIRHTVAAMVKIFGGTRKACIARELTKTYEQVVSATLADLLAQLDAEVILAKGEFVLVVSGAVICQDTQEISRVLELLLSELSVKQAVALTCKITGAAKNQVYPMALAMK